MTKTNYKIPLSSLYIEDYEFLGKDIPMKTSEWENLYKLYSGKSIYFLRGHIKLFHFFSGITDIFPAEYLDWYEKIFTTRNQAPPLTRDQKLHERHGLYTFMCETRAGLRKDDDFFVIDAKYDHVTGRFIMNDCHQRAAFMIAMGDKYANVSCSNEDYEAYLNREQAHNVNLCIDKQKRSEFYTPVFHPLVKFGKSYREVELNPRFLRLADLFAYYPISRVIDFGSNIGFYTNLWAKNGCEAVGIENHYDHYELAVELGKLEKSNAKFLFQSITECNESLGQFELGILLTVLYHALAKSENDARELLSSIEKIVSDFIAWESGEFPEKEIEFIINNSSFKHYHEIGITTGTGRIRKLGIFSKDKQKLDVLKSRNRFSDRG